MLIAHRRNTLLQLLDTPRSMGVEIDIRCIGERLILQHDPFVEGESLDAWIENYRHGTLILNVKEEGLEHRLIAMMKTHGISDFFFLDQSFPFLMKSVREGEKRCAVRVSEFESLDTALALAGRIEWVWVDCFSRFPLSGEDAARLRDAGFKLCLVSPELQGRDPVTEVPAMRSQLKARSITAEAVCTKRADLWGDETP